MRILLLFSFLLTITATTAQVVINELSASNQSVIEDEFGESSDWIELYNTGATTINLEGWFLSDDDRNVQKWIFPSVDILPNSFLIIFASDRNVQNTFLHTSFKLSASGETISLSTPSGELIDQKYYFNQEQDRSLGRLQDGAAEWGVFDNPTPENSNNSSTGLPFAKTPEWLTAQQYFDSSTAIDIQNMDSDAVIYFTRDGRQPTITDEQYNGPISLDTTTALRIVAIAPGKLPSATLTKTFFIEEDHVLPIISIVGDPVELWSWEKGILVHGGPNAEPEWPFWGANYWSEEEVPIHFEFLTESRELGIAFYADTRTHGGRGARTQPMKPLRILPDKKYGNSTVSYPFFENRERTEFTRLVIRNASGDYNNAHCRDAFLARYFIDEGLNIDVLAHRPVIVYINGAYYGVQNLREKSDEYYLQHNFGVDIDQLDLLEEHEDVVVGDFTVFDEMYDFVLSNDLSQTNHYEQAKTYFDIENIAEGFIVQTGLNNGDWLSNNIKYWRERKPDAKWRYIIFDMDIAMGRHGWSDYKVDMFGDKMTRYADTNKHVNIFKAFLENEQYKNYFLNRYADLLNTTFRPEIFVKEVDRTINELDPEMPRYFTKWTWPGYETWQNHRVAKLYEYLELRPAYARDFLRDYFALPNEVELRLNTFPPNAGSIEINTIEPENLPWDGIYFNGVPVTLTIKPAPGFTFSHWGSARTILTKDANTTIAYNFEMDDEIVAYFEHNEPALVLEMVNPVTSGELNLSLTLANPSLVAFELFDIQGRKVTSFEDRELSVGKQHLSLSVPHLPSGTYLLQVTGSGFAELVRVVLVR